MKKLAIAITSLLLMTGCSSTPTITNTNNIKEHILKDNVAYDSFSSYSDSDTIIRLPNGEYIHGTKEVNGKYYDSDQDSGAIQAKKAKYYALLATDVNNYLTENLKDSMIQMKFSIIIKVASQMHLQSLMKMVMKQTWPIIQTMNL